MWLEIQVLQSLSVSSGRWRQEALSPFSMWNVLDASWGGIKKTKNKTLFYISHVLSLWVWGEKVLCYLVLCGKYIKILYLTGWEQWFHSANYKRWRASPLVRLYRYISFCCAQFHCASQEVVLFFQQIESLWQHYIKQVYQHHFFQQYLLTLSLCHVLLIFGIFQMFSILIYCYGNLWLVWLWHFCKCFGAPRPCL